MSWLPKLDLEAGSVPSHVICLQKPFPVAQRGKNLAAMEEGSIPGSRRAPEGGNGYPF